MWRKSKLTSRARNKVKKWRGFILAGGCDLLQATLYNAIH